MVVPCASGKFPFCVKPISVITNSTILMAAASGACREKKQAINYHLLCVFQIRTFDLQCLQSGMGYSFFGQARRSAFLFQDTTRDSERRQKEKGLLAGGRRCW
jgi:hypothetical protein